MLVPVSFVGGVTVPVVDVIDVVTVRDSLMPTAVTMGVLMVSVLRMRQVALVVVIVVSAMGVAVVDVIDVTLMFHSRMAATGSVLMGVIFMHAVITRTHGFSLRNLWVEALNPDQPSVLHKPFCASLAVLGRNTARSRLDLHGRGVTALKGSRSYQPSE